MGLFELGRNVNVRARRQCQLCPGQLEARVPQKYPAEGVEHELQARILRSQGCDEAQGYLFSPPIDAVSFERWVRNGTFPLAVFI